MNLPAIIIADDHRLFRSALKFLLEANGKYRVVAEAQNGKELLDLLPDINPDLVIMDISMPYMNGIEASRLALTRYPALKILIISMFGEPQYYYSLLDLGVKGFLLKDSDNDEFLVAVAKIISGDTYFSQKLLMSILKDNATGEPVKLSQREMEVLKKVCLGLSNQEIASDLNLSQRTVERHKTNLLIKTGSKNSVRLIIYALKNNLIEF